MQKLFFLLLIFLTATVFGQNVKEPINSSEIYAKSLDFYREEKYPEALAEMEKIDRNDTNYVSALLERVIMNLKLDRFDEAIRVSREGLALGTSNQSSFYVDLGASLNSAKHSDEALSVLEEGLKKFPKNYLLTYNKGVVYKTMGKFPEAIEMYKAAILLNPYYANSHLNLGLMACDEGQISKALLSFNMFVLLEPGTNRSLQVLKKMLEIVSSKYERTPKNIELSPEGGDDFSEMDLIISNYSALDPSYKIPVKTDLASVKQTYALFSKMEYIKNDKGFWMQTYVPLFKEIVNQQKFSAFTWYSLQSSENEKHKELVKKNMPEINKFIVWIGPYLEKIRNMRVIQMDGKLQEMQHWYDPNRQTLSMICNLNATTNKLSGPCELYYSNGIKSAKGNYNSAGEKEGLWYYYHYKNGALSDSIFYKNGKIEGLTKWYYPDGTISGEASYINGNQQGIRKEYSRAGLLLNQYIFKENVLDGPTISYYNIGEAFKEYEGKYKEGKLNDTLYEFHDNGVLKSSKFMSNGKVGNGYIKTFHRNGQLATTVNKINGLFEGIFRAYNYNGKLSQEGQYLGGIEIGTWKTYYDNGKLEEEIQYDEKGKKNGILKNYDLDGKIIYEMEYLKGEVVAYKYYDKEGKILKEARKHKGEFEFVGFYPEGTKNIEGIYTAEGRTKLWKFYDSFGNLTSEENYNNKGKLQGKVKNYYTNGKLKDEMNYVNDLPEGYYVSYYKNGKIMNEGWYENGKMKGYWNAYYADGTPENRLYYVMGNLKGYQQYFHITGVLEKEEFIDEEILTKIIYYDTLGTVKETVELKNGTGNYISHHNNKKVDFSGNYILGINHGKIQWNYCNGNLSSSGNYFNDKMDGPWKWYQTDGKLKTEGNYKYGLKDGKWIYYFPSGKIEVVENYINGVLTGDITWYNENGQIETRKPYVDNEAEGRGYFYDETGELQFARDYHKGKVIAYTYNDASGKLIAPVNIANGTFKFLTYYKNGNKSREYESQNGVIVGTYNEYYSNGKLCESYSYQNGEYDGAYTTYYSDGKLKSILNYKEGLLEGPGKFYYPDGKLKKELNYKLDALHGNCKFYNNSGQLIKWQIFYSDNMIKEEKY
jgi:uncharacterized protein